ncbi:MAG: amidohydrolase family protein [Helicobacteraceae bacterium]|jgi:predicted TIM-barrel fold metal-dependent hydrolase|nr:amidohydrolase family protein [Helicobacteraceae bacterium]
MKIIDTRCRPAFLHPFFGANDGSSEFETAKWLNKRVGTRGDLAHFVRSRTEEGFLNEVRSAGLTYAVVVGRRTPTQQIDDKFVARIVAPHKELLGVGGVDPALDGADETIRRIDYAIDELKLKAIDIEPSFAAPPRHADDPLYFPIYEHLSKRKIPLTLMSGPTASDQRFNDPSRLSLVAANFPALSIVVYHGYYPNTAGLVGAAFRYENIFPVPDMYGFVAGGEPLIDAARTFLQDQLLFGSSYPFRPIAQSIEDFKAFGFSDAVLEKLLFNNAARVFNVE